MFRSHSVVSGWTDTVSEAASHQDQFETDSNAPRIVEIDSGEETEEVEAPPTYEESEASYTVRPLNTSANRVRQTDLPQRAGDTNSASVPRSHVRFVPSEGADTHRSRRQHSTPVVQDRPSILHRTSAQIRDHLAARRAESDVPQDAIYQRAALHRRRRSNVSNSQPSDTVTSGGSVTLSRRHGLRVQRPDGSEIRQNPILNYLLT